MKAKTLDIDVADEDTDGIGDGLTGAGPFGTGDFVATGPTDGLAHQLSLTSTANLSGITVTVTGTDEDNNTQSENITGPNNTTVEGSKYFKTVSTISVSATLGANTLDVGWVDEVASQTIIMSPYATTPATVSVNQTGTMNWDIQVTNQNPWGDDVTDQESLFWTNDANFSGVSADDDDDLATAGVFALRFVTNSYSSGAEAQVYLTFPM